MATRAKARARRAKHPATADELAGIRQCVDVLPDPGQLERFARLAREEDARNVAGGLDAALAAGAVLMVGGDGKAPRVARIAFLTAKLWKNGRTLRVAFLDGTSAQKEFVRKTAPKWCEHANLKMEFVSGSAGDVRVSFKQGGAWSYIGTDCLGIPARQPTMQLGWLDDAVVLHEFGHALGCIHEHQHPENGIPWDREAVYRYFSGPPNYWDRATIDSNLFGKYSATQTQFSKYDRLSIMHYSIAKELLTDPSFAVGWNTELSEADRTYAAAVYPGEAPPPPPPPGEKVEIPKSGRYQVVTVPGQKQALVFNP